MISASVALAYVLAMAPATAADASTPGDASMPAASAPGDASTPVTRRTMLLWADPAAGEQGVVARLKEWLTRGADVGGQVERFASAAGRVVEDVTNLIVVFLFRTMVFPLAFSWLLYRVVLAVFRPVPAGVTSPRT